MTTHQPTVKNYLVVYILLLAGLAATVSVAYLHLGYANVALSLLIAFTKATLVVWYFMHVKSSPELNKIAICAGLVWLCIMFGLTLIDYGSRSWIRPSQPMISKSANAARHTSIGTTMKCDLGQNAEAVAAAIWSAVGDTLGDTGERKEKRREEKTAKSGGDDRSRTCTPVKELDPKSSASANSATSPCAYLIVSPV